MKTVKRGYLPSDDREFSNAGVAKLQEAGCDLFYLLNQGYPIKSSSVFIGNHYLLSERQRLALVRSISSKDNIEKRKRKEQKDVFKGCEVHIDGFNTIITLEVALSGSPIFQCMDGTIRDLAGLRGTYRLIDKTNQAILLIGQVLEEMKIKKAVFFLDLPVSNSGRLRKQIFDLLQGFSFEVQAEVIYNVDATLAKLDHVITSDAIILDHCRSWINLNRVIIEQQMPGHCIELGMKASDTFGKRV